MKSRTQYFAVVNLKARFELLVVESQPVKYRHLVIHVGHTEAALSAEFTIDGERDN